MMQVQVSSAGAKALLGDRLSTDLRSADLVAAAARCWRAARDRGAPVQQRLHAMLAGRGQEMLAPMFDSLIALCEAALGRRIVVGEAAALSGDEALLVAMLDGSRGCEVAGSSAGVRKALASAVRSARVMLGMGRAERGSD